MSINPEKPWQLREQGDAGQYMVLVDHDTRGQDWLASIHVNGELGSVDNKLVAKKMAAADDLLGAVIEALSLFDNYPQLHEQVGTYQRLVDAVARCV